MWIFDKFKKLYIKYSKKKADGGIVLHKDESFVISSPYRNQYYVQFHDEAPQSCLDVEITATHRDTRESLIKAFELRKPVAVSLNDNINLTIIINSIKETVGKYEHSLTVSGGTYVSGESIYE